MEKVLPVRFRRIAAAFNDASRAIRDCESSGSDYSPDNSADLSDLVNSFIERECMAANDNMESIHQLEGKESQFQESKWNCSDSDSRSLLENMMLDDNNEDDSKEKIRAETQLACGLIEAEDHTSSSGFKRRLMSHLRDKGFDAGLCKSKWEKFGQHPAGMYEYIDVNINGNRYIVEINLAGEFEIARPTASYSSLLSVLPQVYVGKPEELKQIVRLMCNAIRESMKGMDLRVPPWRRRGYMQAKWFGHYKRTSNEIPTRKGKGPSQYNEALGANQRLVGFDNLPGRVYPCRDDFAKQGRSRVGYLSAAFTGISMGIDT